MLKGTLTDFMKAVEAFIKIHLCNIKSVKNIFH